ncbi:hypothetical protein GC194_09860, partial [bacterium]|nr:hypothetical protein [bacterium]
MHKVLKYILILFCSLAGVSIVIPQKYNDTYAINSFDEQAKSLMESMSLEEKIGQIFMVPVYSDRSAYHKKEILELIEKQHIGGVIFMKGHPYKQYKWTHEFNTASKIDLLVAMDAEWGLAMRLD